MRAATDAIRQRRLGPGSCYLLTGGTGFLGAHVATALLRRGARLLLLARRRGELSAEDRVATLLRWFGLDAGAFARLQVLEGDVEASHLGLDLSVWNRLAAEVHEIIHFASDTSFAERKRQAVEATNVAGLRNVLDFARNGRCDFFHHVSTAYVAGRRPGLCREELTDTDQFTNVYEETKHRAERLARQICSESGIRLNVYRPSIVYGSTQDGRSLRFDALYYPVRIALTLRDQYLRDLSAGTAQHALAVGVRLTSEGRLYLPVRIEVRPGAGINAIPVDYFTAAFTALLEQGLEGETFHVVSRNPTSVQELAEFTCRMFNMEGIQVVDGAELTSGPRNSLEMLFQSYVEPYLPYMQDLRIFDDTNAARILDPRGISCPRLDYAIFSRCMTYAVRCHWRREPG